MDISGMRYEIKLRWTANHADEARRWLRLHPMGFVEAYPPRRVNSIYFDSAEGNNFMDNVVGVGRRRKLRFRWYGPSRTDVQGRLELKHKSNQLGWKEVCPIPHTFDLTALPSWGLFAAQLSAYATPPFTLALAQFPQVALYVYYRREYYESGDRCLRVTLDTDVHFYEQWLTSRPNFNRAAWLEPSPMIIEIKAGAKDYRRVAELLSAFPLTVDKSSKYVEGLTWTMGLL